MTDKSISFILNKSRRGGGDKYGYGYGHYGDYGRKYEDDTTQPGPV